MSNPPKPSKPAKAAKAQRATKKAPPSKGAAEAAGEPVAEKAAAKTAASSDDPPLVKRLSEMTDFQLRAYQESMARISQDSKHAKSAVAKTTLALIEKEIARRLASPGSAPSGVRIGVASPKLGKKRD